MKGPFFARTAATAKVSGVAIGLVELSSIVRGHVVLDAMVKKAPVHVVASRSVSPGKFIVLVSGAVAEVDEAMQAGLAVADKARVDHMQLAQVADALLDGLAGKFAAAPVDGSLGLVELDSVSSTVLSADAACKAAEVTLVGLVLADGIGGKGYYLVGGEQADVEAAVAAGQGIAGVHLVGTELIARPHTDYLEQIWK